MTPETIDALIAEHGGLVPALVANPHICAELAELEDLDADTRHLIQQVHWAISEGYETINVIFPAETVTVSVPANRWTPL